MSPDQRPARPIHFLHEYQAGALLDSYKVPTAIGRVAFNAEDAFKVCADFGPGAEYVVKAQVLTGGRGLGTFDSGFKGGVHIVDTPEKVQDIASNMLGARLITKQSGPEGFPCSAVYMVEKLGIRSEFYLSITLDRAAGCPTFIYSPAGGMNIEDVAEKTPELVYKVPIREAGVIPNEEIVLAAQRLGIPSETEQVSNMFNTILDTFYGRDCDMVEINPLVMTNDDKLIAADSKITIDSNAFFRQKDIFAQEDTTANDPRETLAAKYDLNYIHIGGKIGCLVNGAGLAMSTMDIIKLYGGEPANFLDVGGGATKERVTEAFKIILSDDSVKAVLVNIFGGIVRCDLIAEGIIGAVKEVGVSVPVVVRLEGNNAELGSQKLAESGLDIIAATSLSGAAQQVVAAAGGQA